ncbi:hypothetical protein FSB73_21250 [Arachidicoccus ginsenosidivorans]|uniref:Uncharacterized protein n=1 Tax=Arachidicoccus ginsenosidivorans TaxID=496057 RepID=A0A5B8VQ99_9BACT|nr:PD-(D/E)XK nuclease family transposase [Arachidicoccus ginsenosidivorans]QEC73814.1 hypothetical protein FSB73_21250 [Arachidicoccus ginsenosidivorans]
MKMNPEGLRVPSGENTLISKKALRSKNGRRMKLTGPLSEGGVFVSLKGDFGIKRVFRSPEGKEDLKRMITALGDGFIEALLDIDFDESEMLGSIKDERKVIFDFGFNDKHSRVFDLEMQQQYVVFMLKRAFCYTSRYHSTQMRPGEDYKYDHWPITGVVITDFNMPELKDGPCVDLHEIVSRSTKRVSLVCTNLLTVELSKFNKGIDELEGEKDVFLFLLANMGKLTEIPASLDNEKYRPLFERARIANFNKEEMKRYNALNRQKKELMQNCILQNCKVEKKVLKKVEKKALKRGR